MEELLKEIHEILKTMNGISLYKVRKYARVLSEMEAEKQ